ncbi:MAG TPA: anti-sigma factor antagonist [Solirubrobacteraceae bacterium]|nr:anti-sigma factor antagonist [Solirubrobacteraceae bacterium]
MGFLPNLQLDTLETESELTIKLAGELDSGTSPKLFERFEQALASIEGRQMVIDLDEVSFIDSSGLRALILIERRAEEERIALAIAPPPAAVTELLRVTGLADRIPLTPRAGDAPPAGPFLERMEIALPRDADAPARARAELRQAILGRLSDRDSTTATLLTSELVTNAVIHPAEGVGGSVGLRITTYDDRVRVEVTDEGSGFEPGGLPPRRPREAGGHGLIVVDGLSSRWGAARRPVGVGAREGFCVWFELDADSEQIDGGPPEDQFSTPSRSQQYSSRHSLASSTQRASESHGSTVSNA